MPGLTTQINNYNKNKWKVRFSNIPNMTGQKIDIHVLNNYVREFNVPDITIPMLTSITGHERQLHPNTIGSRDLQTINIAFTIDEHMYNYWLLYTWLYQMRHGKTLPDRTNLDGVPLVRMDCIDVIELCLLDNDKKIISKMKFHHCILNNMGALDLKYSDSELGTMVCTFEVENVSFEVNTEGE